MFCFVLNQAPSLPATLPLAIRSSGNNTDHFISPPVPYILSLAGTMDNGYCFILDYSCKHMKAAKC